MKITAITLRNAGSYGPSQVTIGPLDSVASFIGKNNAGKSNIFKLIRTALLFGKQAQDGHQVVSLPLKEASWHMGMSAQSLFVGLDIALSPEEARQIDVHTEMLDSQPYSMGVAIVQTSTLGQAATTFHVECSTPPSWHEPNLPLHQQVVQFIEQRVIYLESQRRLSREQVSTSVDQPVHVQGFNGSELKKWLNGVLRARTPSAGKVRDAYMSDLHAIEGFAHLTLATTPGDQGALDLLVTDGEKGYPSLIEECGTGLQMAIIVLAALHMGPGHIVMVDDMETGLHPSAQSDFIKVAGKRAETMGGQLLFSTHSPALLDGVPDDSIFEVSKTLHVSTVRQIQQAGTALMRSLESLGYRPSLVRMANVVVFVEGPSDAAAFASWWKTLFDDVPEPKVVFLPLGGSNLVHLTAAAVSSLARPAFIIMDSDRPVPDAPESAKCDQVRANVRQAGEVIVLEYRALESYFSAEAVEMVLNSSPAVADWRYVKLEEALPQYRKAKHAGEIAAAMGVDQIDHEIRDLLERVRAAAWKP